MTLPYDYARCDGVLIDGIWREGCCGSLLRRMRKKGGRESKAPC